MTTEALLSEIEAEAERYNLEAHWDDLKCGRPATSASEVILGVDFVMAAVAGTTRLCGAERAERRQFLVTTKSSYLRTRTRGGSASSSSRASWAWRLGSIGSSELHLIVWGSLRIFLRESDIKIVSCIPGAQ